MDFDTSHLNTAPLASPVQSSQTTANDEGDYQFSLNEPFPGIFNDSEFNDNFDIYQSALSGLTESEETKKQRKDATPQNDAPNVTFPTYNPATLLNPKSAKRSAADSEAREDTPAQPINAAESSNGMSSMLERIHNVQQRHDQPVRKRRRVHPALADDADDPEEKVQEKSTNGFDGVSGGTVLGDYIKDKKAEGQKEAIANGNTVVDLTNGKLTSMMQMLHLR